VTDARALYETFVSHLERGTAPAAGAEEALATYVQTARAAWPELDVDAEELARHLATRAIAGAPPPLAHAADVYLALACARGVPGAAAAFDRVYGNVIARVLSRRRAADDVADDASQLVRERLLVAPPGGAPKIADYTGIGALRSWVSTAAATTLAMMRRASARRREEAPRDDDDADAAVLGAATGPELRYMKERYKSEIGDAIKHALTQLSDRDRTLLRLHLGEQMGIDRLGALYKVDRSTAARWLGSARAALVAAARDEMRARLRLSESECESIAALVQSELHVSFARLLA
jgi:RNA polymerase sigma-70 factor (ECF subfamily)